MSKIKERVGYIDICKGGLIIMLMFSHLTWISTSFHGIENYAINQLSFYSNIWNCFFMSCFFVISGMFSNFQKPYNKFFVDNFKALIIPSLISLVLLNLPKVFSLDYYFFFKYIFLYGGSLWFLSALFLSKIVLWYFIKWIKIDWIIIVLLLLMSLFGKFLDDINIIPNYWFHRNFLNFALYLGLGYYFKNIILNKRVGAICMMFFTLTIVSLLVLNEPVPNVVSIFNETLYQHPLTIWLSVTGSVSCIHFCKMINHNPVLEYLGRNSLIIYIYHMIFLSHCVIALKASFNNEMSLFDSALLIFLAVAGTLVLCSGYASIVDLKYFRWIKGVF